MLESRKKKKVNDFEKSSLSYFKDIGGFKKLTKKEEYDLWKDYKINHNLDSRNKLITSNLKFVASVARKYVGRGLSYADLISEGNVGLIKALDKFDAEKGNKVISYSVWWIRQNILEAIEKRNGTTGENLPTDTEMQIYDTDEDTEDYNTQFISNDFEEMIRNKELREVVDVLSKCLNKRELYIVQKYYGIDCDRSYTLEEIGKELGLTKERIRQINEKALKKLRSEAVLNYIDGDIYI